MNDPSFKVIKLLSLIWLDTVDEEDSKPFSVPTAAVPDVKSAVTKHLLPHQSHLTSLSQWLSGLAGKLVEQRRQVAQEGCAVPSQSRQRYYSTHSEHRFPAPSSKEGCRKPVLGV